MSFAMANALPEVRKCARYITDKTNGRRRRHGLDKKTHSLIESAGNYLSKEI